MKEEPKSEDLASEEEESEEETESPREEIVEAEDLLLEEVARIYLAQRACDYRAIVKGLQPWRVLPTQSKCIDGADVHASFHEPYVLAWPHNSEMVPGELLHGLCVV